MRIKAFVLIVAFSGFGFVSAVAGGKVWVGLYHAKNSSPSAEAQVASENLSCQLREVFGFKHYQLIKCGEIDLSHEWEQWVVPRKDFFIGLIPLPSQPGEPKIVEYEIYQDGFIVAGGRYEPYDGVPLFINGPDYHRGKLVFVLEAR